MNESTLCPLAWNHFSVNLDTSMRVCCNTHNGGVIFNEQGGPIRLAELTDLGSYYNTPYFRNMRRQMMNGERPEHCTNCFMTEDLGGRSLRQIYFDQYSNDPGFQRQLMFTKSDGTIIPRVTYLDFSLSNKCNLKCIMCSPSASTILRSDFEALNWNYDKEYYRMADEGWKDEEKILKTFELILPTLREMLFTGGEPLVAPLHIRLLERAVETGRAQHLVLRYHSNCTNIPPKLLTVWKEFKRIDFHASVEGVGEVNDYVRFGSDFSVVESNILKVAELPNARVEIHTCFQIPTLLRLPELHRWVAGLHPKIPKLPYHIWVNHPAWLEAYNLRDDLKVLVRERVAESVEQISKAAPSSWVNDQQAQVQSMLARMDSRKSDPNHWHEFKSRISELESLRKNSLKDLCPELFA